MIIRPDPGQVVDYRNANSCSVQEARREILKRDLQGVIDNIADKNVADVLETLVHYAHLR